MTAGGTYWVTPLDGGNPYRVVLAPAGPGWRASVERGGKAWTFDLETGPAPGLAWVGDRPRHSVWEPADGGAGVLEVDGEAHSLTVETEAHHRVAALSRRTSTGASVREVRAPMPGLVLALEVAEDDLVEPGDGILIIEAMKMENEVTAPVAGRVHGIAVRAGEPVEGNTLLCRIEPAEDDGSEGGGGT